MPGGEIGEHRAGFGQLLLVAAGEGGAAGADDGRVALSSGQGAYFERGEVHVKGSETSTTAIMVQVAELTPGLAAPKPMAPPHNGRHSTADTTALIIYDGAARRVMRGVGW